MGKLVREFLEPVAQCGERDTLDQVLDMLGAGNPVAVRWQGRWRLLLPEVVAGYLPGRRVIDLPLSEASLVTPDLPAQDALTQLIDRRTPYALVTKDERLVGIITQGRLLEYAAEVERTWTEVALQASEARLRTAFQNVPFDFWVRDRDGRCIFQNPASIRQWGNQVGKGIDEADVDEETLAGWQRNNRRVLAGEVVEDDVEYSHQGETRYLHSIVAPILVGGRVHGVLGFNIDITERKLAEEELHARTQQLESIRVVTAEITRELDPMALLRLITQRAVELVGVVSGTVWLWDEETQMLVPKAWQGSFEWQGEVRLRLGEGVPGMVAQRREGLIVNDYRTSPYALSFFLERTDITAAMGEPLMYREQLLGVLMINNIGTGRHFTEQDRETVALFAGQAAIAIENARLFQSVSEQHAQLRNLTARLADVGEMQGQRLSRELHDCVGGNLTALNLNLSIVLSQLQAQGSAKATARIEDSMRLVEEAVQHIRRVMTELRPPLLDDQGLVASLRWYADQFSVRTSVASAVRGEEPRPRLPRSAEIALFRIAQEVLTNVAKHAQAGEVTLMLEETAEKVRLTIADDGVGFDPATVRPSGERPWWGLITMRERAAAIGGSLRVESTPESGTRVIVEVPR